MKSDYELLVVGAGPAGMAAAQTAAALGVGVAVIDEQAHPGGQIYRDIDRSPLADIGLLGPDYAAGLSQVETFQKLSDVSGLVMTKLDGTAKGGVLVALADKFGLPIHAIGVGEAIDDLQPFDPEEFAAALTGLGAD